MAILRLVGATKGFTSEPLFADLDLDIEEGERLGMIGVNGCGKSTLMKVMAGVETLDSGQRVLTSGKRIGYLSQNPLLDDALTVRKSLYAFHTDLLELEQRYQEVCRRLESSHEEADLKRLESLSHQLEHAGFYELETRAAVAMTQLGLNGIEDMPVGSLSGGQRRRLALAQALTAQPDLLLLDEPTNHLDTDAIVWLEGYLKHYAGGLVVITHDRYFLDAISLRTLEVAGGQVLMFTGNYAAYLEKRAELASQAEASESKRLNLLRRELEWLHRGPRARATKQKARIERAHALHEAGPGEAARKLEIGLSTARMGKKILELEKLSKGWGSGVLIKNLTYLFKPGDRIGLIGPNGCGKTTLLEVIAGRTQPDQGSLEMGSTIKLGYYDQETRALDPAQRVIDALTDIAETIPLTDGRTVTASQMLERFLFPGRLQQSPVGKLSGGERRRLYLLQVLMGNPNLLLLDEPTNDLDIPTLTCLEDYLDAYTGCLVVSSHDRCFLDRTVESLFAFMGQGEVRELPGGWEEDLGQPARSGKTGVAPAGTPPVAPSTPKVRKLSFKEQRELSDLEKSIERSESRKAELELQLSQPSSDAAAVSKAYAELEKLASTLERDVARWAELAELA